MTAREALIAFLSDRKIKPATFAGALPYDKANFHRLLNNEKAKPSLELAARIERQTGGAIRASDWVQAA